MRIATEILAKQIGGDRQSMVGVGRHFVLPASFSAQPHGTHQRLDAIQTAGVVKALAQHALDSGRTVTAPMAIKYRADLCAQAIPLLRPARRRTASPGVESRLRHAEHPAHHRQRIGGHQFGQHEGVLHRLSRAKYAAAFFRILTSILARDSSARKRAFSACSGLTARRPATAVNCPASYCFSQSWMSMGKILNFRPHSAKLRFSAFR